MYAKPPNNERNPRRCKRSRSLRMRNPRRTPSKSSRHARLPRGLWLHRELPLLARRERLRLEALGAELPPVHARAGRLRPQPRDRGAQERQGSRAEGGGQVRPRARVGLRGAAQGCGRRSHGAGERCPRRSAGSSGSCGSHPR
eukprot:scaffold3808_cov222-Pinguiococcus_pyrenoidosus.AAC.9